MEAALWTEKYRPKKLDEIQDQEEIVSRLKEFVRSGTMPHCLFAGPPGTGKTTAALCLAHDLFGTRFQDVFMGLAKPVLFGFIIASVGCYYGISTRGGTQGVGRATTQAVVASSILIITVDFFVTRLSMTLFGQ